MSTVGPYNPDQNTYMQFYNSSRNNGTQDFPPKQHSQDDLDVIQQQLQHAITNLIHNLMASQETQPSHQVPPSGGSTSSSSGQGNDLGSGDAGHFGFGAGPQGPAGGKYDDLIEKHANQHGIDPAIMKSLMAKESQGDPNAVSSAGAVGLLQIKPETAREIANDPTISAEDLKDPELNIELGTKYFAKMLAEKNGNLEDALGAYNQGPNAHWQSIPESQDYVASIMESLRTGTLPTWG